MKERKKKRKKERKKEIVSDTQQKKIETEEIGALSA